MYVNISIYIYIYIYGLEIKGREKQIKIKGEEKSTQYPWKYVCMSVCIYECIYMYTCARAHTHTQNTYLHTQKIEIK